MMSSNAFQYFEIDFDLCGIQNEVLTFTLNLEEDAWRKGSSLIKGIIENYFKECLEAYPEDPHGDVAVFASPSDPDRDMFELQVYKTNILTNGLSVAFTITVNGDNYYLCCSEDMKLYFKQGKCPDSIPGDKSEVIFFQKQFSPADDSFKFESSSHKDHFLAVSGDKQKLILKKPSDEVDETTKFNINDPHQI